MDEIAKQEPPNTWRDVLVTLGDGSRAYGYCDIKGWWIYPNDVTDSHLNLDLWNSEWTDAPVISWEEIPEPEQP